MKKRVISFFLCIVMLVGLLPTATFAATCEHIKSENYVEVTAPTCYQNGVGRYYCVLCDYTMGKTGDGSMSRARRGTVLCLANLIL